MAEYIVSRDNKQYKFLKKLKDKKYRDQNNVFLAEGEKFLKENIHFSKIIINESKYKYFEDKYNISKYDNVLVLAENLFEQISTQETSQGILLIYSKNAKRLDEIKGDVVVLDDVQDPGNIGTIIRTMIATKFINLLLTKSSVDVYSPKVVRATMGGIFKVNVIYSDYSEVVLNKNNNAYVFGHEGNGISQEILNQLDQKAIIPIYGDIESLNVSVAVAVFLYKMREKYFELV